MVVWGNRKKQKQREASYTYKLNMNFKIYLILPDKTKQVHLPWMGRVLQQCSSQEDQEDLKEHESCSQISYTYMDHHIISLNLNIVEKL